MTISTRLWLSAAVSLLALLAFCVALFGEQGAARRAEATRSTVRKTIGTANNILSELKDVETGSRGFVLTGEDRYLEPLVAGRKQLPVYQRTLQDLTRDADPNLKAEVAELDRMVAQKNLDADRLIAGRRRAKGTFAPLAELDESKRVMDAARSIVATIGVQGAELLTVTSRDLEAVRQRVAIITVAGAAFVALIVLAATSLSLRSFGFSLSRLQRALNDTGRVGAGDHNLIETDEGDFAGVAASFNDLAVRLSSEEVRRNEAERNLNVLNDTLTQKAQELETYSKTVNIVRRMADRLPSCTDEAEFSAVIRSFAPQLTPDRAGALYLLNHSHNLLRLGSAWNGPVWSLDEFTPEECWGLRRGQDHVSGEGQVEIACPHITDADGRTHWCMPLVAQSETVGLLFLEGADGAAKPLRAGGEDVTYMLRETVALGLVNLRLREKLRSQSVRDPLTGLYNRRYLDESLELELARALRSEDPISAIMLDIDHFKKFNDTFGHDAGDLVLKEVADVLARSMRKGDIAGRFGGEEFLLLMPGADAERAIARAETMRKTIGSLDVGYAGQKLGRITASFGVATFPIDGESGAALIQAADKALYAAKAAGRDRVIAAA